MQNHILKKALCRKNAYDSTWTRLSSSVSWDCILEKQTMPFWDIDDMHINICTRALHFLSKSVLRAKLQRYVKIFHLLSVSWLSLLIWGYIHFGVKLQLIFDKVSYLLANPILVLIFFFFLAKAFYSEWVIFFSCQEQVVVANFIN